MLENATVGLWKPWGMMSFHTEQSRGGLPNFIEASCSSRVTLCVITVELTVLYCSVYVQQVPYYLAQILIFCGIII